MSFRRRTAPRFIAALVALCAASSCSQGADEVVFGAAGPWTEEYGLMNKQGMDLATEEINERGGINGRRLRLESRDDGGDGAKAAAIATEFMADERIVAVVGHVNSGAMVAAARIYDGGLPAVATTATSPDLTGISPWVFRVALSDSTNGLDLARFAGTLGHRRAAVLYENNSYGRGLTESFRRNFRGEIISVDPIAEDGENVEPFIAFLKERRPDIVFVAGTERSGIAILRGARAAGLTADFIGGDGWSGVIADSIASEGAYVGDVFSAGEQRPEVRRFADRYRAKYGRLPTGNAALAYDATMVLARAAMEAGTSRTKIRDFLAAIDEGDAMVGASGPIRFGPDGDRLGRTLLMMRATNGQLSVETGK